MLLYLKASKPYWLTVVHTLHAYDDVICELTYDASILARLPRPSLTTIAPGDRATRIGSTTGNHHQDHLNFKV